MRDPAIVDSLRRKYQALRPSRDERLRRNWAAAEALEWPWGGLTTVAEATGLSLTTIRRGVHELTTPGEVPVSPTARRRIRPPGGGRKTLARLDPTLVRDLERLVDPGSRGDPESPLRWTCKRTRDLADELHLQGHRASPGTVAARLKPLKYRLQAPCQTREGWSHADRNQQFEQINDRVLQFLWRGQPVVSVDTQKKELIGDFKNGGREYQPREQRDSVSPLEAELATVGR